ncbi:MAG: prepilin peptidase [Candidatus Omnitrophica bacterium]|nr:prepilin peptidase [Candidatus Omnitrophota bacterium]
MQSTIIFIFGLVIGSFLNVCIHRIPLGETVITKRSYCPHCKNTIRWYDNIPLISYILLLGRCRYCKGKISPRYIIVEVLSAIMLFFLFRFFDFSIKFFVYGILVSTLIVISFIDIKHRIIPDGLSIGGIAVGFFLSVIFPSIQGANSHIDSLLNSFLGILVGGLIIYLLGLLGNFLFKKESMGGGDVKLLAMIGAFIGWRLVLLTFFIAPIFGSIKLKKGVELIPYAPYLSLGAVMSILYGNTILSYLFGIY